MKITYDSSADAIYICLFPELDKKEGIVEETTGKYPIHFDFTKDGKLFGIEILDASEFLKIENLKKVNFKKIG